MQGTLFPGINPNPKWIPAIITLQECEECGETIAAHELNPNSLMCPSCHDDNYTDCDDCGDSVPNDDIQCDDYNGYCPSCYEARCTCFDCGKVVSSPDKLTENDSGNQLCEDCSYNTLHLSRSGNKVISDEGCKAPTWDVQKTIRHLLFLMKRCRRLGEDWTPHTKIPWGEFEIDNIDDEGILHIGCHKFRISEITRFIDEELPALLTDGQP